MATKQKSLQQLEDDLSALRQKSKLVQLALAGLEADSDAFEIGTEDITPIVAAAQDLDAAVIRLQEKCVG